jgi:hypothetical protein
MAKGKGRSTLLGIQGFVGHVEAPNYDFLYHTSSVKDPKWEIGDRVVLPDGRVFRYGKAAGALNPKFGAKNGVTFLDSDNTEAVAALGATEISITLTATSAGATYFGTKDGMVGGYFSQPDTAHAQFRRIVTHPAGDDGDIIKIKLDAALTKAIAADSFYEILPNPYGYLKQDGSKMSSVMGMPNEVVASGAYFWMQTWGPKWCNPELTGIGSGDNDRLVVFNNAGSVTQALNGTTETFQVAGFIIDQTASGNWTNPPFVMLQISP